MASKQDKFEVTLEELERFKIAFQDARFRELLSQYAEEISNPDNRLRYEQEISEMERERGVDVHFIHPAPSHVLQTKVNGQHTCYLNVCSNPQISEPSCVPGKDETGRPGQHWSLPCTLTPPREELSSDGNKEVIYDVVFHPDTLRLATRSEKFSSMVNLTALSTVARQFDVVLDTVNVKTLNEKYKGVPHAAVIRRPVHGDTAKPHNPNHPHHYRYDLPGEMDRLMYQPQPNNACAESSSPCQEPIVPHYTIKHRSYVDIQDFRNTRDSAPSTVPKELVITVDLPLLSCSSQFIFSIKGKDFRLESLGAIYRLHIKLPYRVDGEQGNARFNTTERQLEVTVPVVPNICKLIHDHTPETTSEEIEISPIKSQSHEEAGKATSDDDPPKSLPQESTERPIVTCSQNATSVTLIIHVKNIDKKSITSEIHNYQCDTHFYVKGTKKSYTLCVEFLPQYNLNAEQIIVKISEDNMVIELTKSSECFGLWKNLFYSINSDSLKERRFINEENISEFLDSSLRHIVPWSTLEDQPIINLVDMSHERTCIQLKKPELVEEEVSREIKVAKKWSDHSRKLDLKDTKSEDVAVPCCNLLTPAQLPSTDVSEEDEGLFFKDSREPTEDDLPDAAESTHSSSPRPSNTKEVLKEVSSSDGSVHDISDHTTQCAIKFENPVLFDMD